MSLQQVTRRIRFNSASLHAVCTEGVGHHGSRIGWERRSRRRRDATAHIGNIVSASLRAKLPDRHTAKHDAGLRHARRRIAVVHHHRVRAAGGIGGELPRAIAALHHEEALIGSQSVRRHGAHHAQTLLHAARSKIIRDDQRQFIAAGEVGDAINRAAAGDIGRTRTVVADPAGSILHESEMVARSGSTRQGVRSGSAHNVVETSRADDGVVALAAADVIARGSGENGRVAQVDDIVRTRSFRRTAISRWSIVHHHIAQRIPDAVGGSRAVVIQQHPVACRQCLVGVDGEAGGAVTREAGDVHRGRAVLHQRQREGGWIGWSIGDLGEVHRDAVAVERQAYRIRSDIRQQSPVRVVSVESRTVEEGRTGEYAIHIVISAVLQHIARRIPVLGTNHVMVRVEGRDIDIAIHRIGPGIAGTGFHAIQVVVGRRSPLVGVAVANDRRRTVARRFVDRGHVGHVHHRAQQVPVRVVGVSGRTVKGSVARDVAVRIEDGVIRVHQIALRIPCLVADLAAIRVGIAGTDAVVPSIGVAVAATCLHSVQIVIRRGPPLVGVAVAHDRRRIVPRRFVDRGHVCGAHDGAQQVPVRVVSPCGRAIEGGVAGEVAVRIVAVVVRIQQNALRITCLRADLVAVRVELTGAGAAVPIGVSGGRAGENTICIVVVDVRVHQVAGCIASLGADIAAARIVVADADAVVPGIGVAVAAARLYAVRVIVGRRVIAIAAGVADDSDSVLCIDLRQAGGIHR